MVNLGNKIDKLFKENIKMKKIIKGIFYILICILILFGICLYFYVQSVKTNMKKADNCVNQNWSVFFLHSTARAKSVKELINSQEYTNSDLKGIDSTILRNLRGRNKYSSECKLDFVELEYELNKKLMNLFDTINANKSKYKDINTIIDSLNLELNDQINAYNESVLSLNQYISMFPNNIIAKRNGFKRKEYFSIKYGIINEDPILKSKELPEWAIGVDTL